jgi:hypothetical protein
MRGCMSGWDTLLRRLAETPRENGTAELHQAAAFLHERLGATGAVTELVPFVAHPHALRLAGVVLLLGGWLYFLWLRSGRPRAALALALAVPVLVIADLEHGAPVFGWIGAERQHHVLARLPAERPEQRLIFAAHYDTKTDLLDHVERAPVDLLGLPVVALMAAAALVGVTRPGRRRAGRWLRTAALVAAPAYGTLGFLALSAGAFLPARSPGAVDDGGSCALLVRLAEALASAPPRQRTEVEVLLLSAEEVGVQGSRVYAAERFRVAPELPTALVNLEGLGAAPDLAVLGRETTTLRTFEPDPRLVTLLDAVHRERRGRGLYLTPWPAGTDARSFMARGVPAATLTSDLPGHALPRDLHSARDDRARLDEAVLDQTLGFLLAVVDRVEARGLRAEVPPQ